MRAVVAMGERYTVEPFCGDTGWQLVGPPEPIVAGWSRVAALKVADELNRLAAEVEWLRAALEWIDQACKRSGEDVLVYAEEEATYFSVSAMARKALAEGGGTQALQPGALRAAELKPCVEPGPDGVWRATEGGVPHA
jgi:hypothetical protein